MMRKHTVLAAAAALMVGLCMASRLHGADRAPAPAASSGPLGNEPLRGSADGGGGSAVAAPAGNPATSSGGGSLEYPRLLGALGVVIGLIFLMRWGSRLVLPNPGGRGANRAVELLTRTPLTPRQQVLLVRVGRRILVLGDSGTRMNGLGQITDPDEVAELIGRLRDERPGPAHKAFAAMFRRSRRPFESRGDDEPASDARSHLLDGPPDDEEAAMVGSAREELSGLRDRVRLLAEQFKGS